MNRYPFIIRGPTRKRLIHAEGKNFYNALEKVLSVYPAKFVNYKNAKAMDLHNTKQIAINLSKKNKGVEHTIWLYEKEGEFSVTFPNKEGFTMMVESETDLAGQEIGTARLNRFVRQAVYVNGNEVQPAPVSGEAPKKGKRLSEEIVEGAEKVKSGKSKNSQSAAAVSATNMKKSKKIAKPAAKKPAAKKEPKEKTIARGNNMFLTDAEWKKVDAILAKEEISFSAWSRGLVQAKIKG